VREEKGKIEVKEGSRGMEGSEGGEGRRGVGGEKGLAGGGRGGKEGSKRRDEWVGGGKEKEGNTVQKVGGKKEAGREETGLTKREWERAWWQDRGRTRGGEDRREGDVQQKG